MVKSYVNIEEMLLATKGIKKVLNELGEMPFETFKEKQEEGMNIDTTLEKQITIKMSPLIF